eukprot:NODE_5630_length_655_cov_6.174917_g5246_i0.p1 GENE.NODE_5630_length_655_cov_6.174917_g5246_i0~~NODE_5630_length_655_cov_6.174917_g5246_i0.p1  ORF type:complete len:169 (+),score=7.43 NODE_5630_length_655_cov_6.174917_g5246_i0:28-507(+)
MPAITSSETANRLADAWLAAWNSGDGMALRDHLAVFGAVYWSSYSGTVARADVPALVERCRKSVRNLHVERLGPVCWCDSALSFCWVLHGRTLLVPIELHGCEHLALDRNGHVSKATSYSDPSEVWSAVRRCWQRRISVAGSVTMGVLLIAIIMRYEPR